MSRHDNTSRIHADAVARTAAQGVSRALEVRQMAAKTELSAAEIDQVSGGASLSGSTLLSAGNLKYSYEWLGGRLDDIYSNGGLMDPGQLGPGLTKGF